MQEQSAIPIGQTIHRANPFAKFQITVIIHQKRRSVNSFFRTRTSLGRTLEKGYASKMDSCKEESFIFYIMKKGTPERSPQQALVFFSDLLRKEHRPCDRPAIIQNANFVYLGEVKKGQIPVFGAFRPPFRVFACEQGIFASCGSAAMPCLCLRIFLGCRIGFYGIVSNGTPTDASKKSQKRLGEYLQSFCERGSTAVLRILLRIRIRSRSIFAVSRKRRTLDSP